MTTRLIGDIHGDLKSYKFINGLHRSSIQLGDFGIGFHDQFWHDSVNRYHENTNHRFIRGNHDFPEKCKKEMSGYIQDGTIEDDIMFVGGAMSIDAHLRTPGLSWWEDEELSYRELSIFIDLFSKVKPRVMITHDCPSSVAYDMFIATGRTYSFKQEFSRTADALQQMFNAHQPDFWFFGHWHYSSVKTIGNTTFVCLGICDDLDVRLYDSDHIRQAVKQKFS